MTLRRLLVSVVLALPLIVLSLHANVAQATAVAATASITFSAKTASPLPKPSSHQSDFASAATSNRPPVETPSPLGKPNSSESSASANDFQSGFREWLKPLLPEGVRDAILAFPIPILCIIALLAIGVVVSGIVEFARKAVGGFKWLGKLFSQPTDALKEVADPDKQQAEHIAELVAAVLDRRESSRASSIDPEERARRDAAIVDLTTERSATAVAAAQTFAAGDLAGAIEILRRDAENATVDAADRWRRLGALVAGVDTATAFTAYESAFRLQPTDFWTCIELSRLRQRIGDLRGSEEAAVAAQRVVTTDRDLSVSHDRIGDVLVAQGDGPGASAAYRKGLAIREALAARDPANTDWQRDLSISHNKVGDVLVAQGDGPGALSAYRKGLAITEALAGRDPGNSTWQVDVAASCAKLGSLENQDAQVRCSFLLCGRGILQQLKSDGRLMPTQDWIAWFDAELAKLS